MCACKHKVSGSFSLPLRGAFHLSFTVLYAIGHQGVFWLGGWSPQFPTGFIVSRGTLDPVPISFVFAYEAFTLSGRPSHAARLTMKTFGLSATPKVFLPPVWPLPRSLATTCGISIDYFSSPYLDVSVQAVPSVYLCIQYTVTEYELCRVSPFGHPRIDACFRLPVAFRRSLRPSSAPGAKASPLCSL